MKKVAVSFLAFVAFVSFSFLVIVLLWPRISPNLTLFQKPISCDQLQGFELQSGDATPDFLQPPPKGATSCGVYAKQGITFYTTTMPENAIFSYYKEKLAKVNCTAKEVHVTLPEVIWRRGINFFCRDGTGSIFVLDGKLAYGVLYNLQK